MRICTRHLGWLVCLVVWVGTAANASAQFAVSSGQRSSGKGRKTGFLQRAAVGAGYTTASEGSGVERFDIYGGGFSGSFATGKFFIQNLAFHVEMFGGVVIDPRLQFGGEQGTLSGDLACVGVGVGATYYFMPINIYLAGTLGAALAQVGGPGISGGGTDVGIGANLLLGKEWWLSDDWGLGAAGHFFLMSLPDESTLLALGAGIVASVSFNASGRPPPAKTEQPAPAESGPSADGRVPGGKAIHAVQSGPEKAKRREDSQEPPAEAGEGLTVDETVLPEATEETEATEQAEAPDDASEARQPMRTVRGRGWAIDVPVAWVEQEHDGSLLLSMREPTMKASSFTTVTIRAEFFMKDSAAYAEKLLEEYASTTLQHDFRKVAGLEGIVLELDLGGMPPQRALLMGTADGGAGYQLWCTADRAVFDEKRPVCEQILNSFRFEHAARPVR